ncbi:intein C-terminal splicing region [Chitinophaga eiseniae]|uniref:Intein C-terminal splicing region n=2 Tax=Chitinophaga eiseniae TaxID=634771 RepID=A0A1T4TID8_9BACT|nr:intein C-terminal splicing region [Chitinophaga eiseniae]
MTSEETVKNHSLFGFKWTTPIHAERADVNYNGTHYYIGYAGMQGTGNQNKIGDFHKWAQNPDPDGLKQFLNEDQSGGAFYTQTAVNLQNNILMYGTLTQKAWFSRLEDKCFVEGPQILTNSGLKKIEEIALNNDLVEDGSVKWRDSIRTNGGKSLLLDTDNFYKSCDSCRYHPIDFLTNQELLLKCWTDSAYPLSKYTGAEYEFQQLINNSVTAVITYSRKDDEREWTAIDFNEITPFTWKWIDFQLINNDGTLTKASLCRPNSWIKELGADSIGNKVYLDMPEFGIQGWAIVKRVRICQIDTRIWKQNRNGDYVNRPITGTFEHGSFNVYNLRFGENPIPLGVTGSHPIWSVDRNNWVNANDLRTGETVKTRNGSLVLTKKEKLDGFKTVYNLEVYRDHNYLVSSDAILVHNACFEKVDLRGKPGGKKIDAAIIEIANGGGVPRIDPKTGTQTVFRGGRQGTNGFRWAGALEYEVPGLDFNYRIYKLETINSSGTAVVKYGYTTTHLESTVHEFKEILPPAPPAAPQQ